MGRLMVLLIAVFVGVTGRVEAQSVAVRNKNYVEVLYFHGKQRCPTCRAVEALSKEVVATDFAAEVKRGRLLVRVIDISKSENEKMAERYEVSWSSLFIDAWKGGREIRNNMTEFAFSNARIAPDKFKQEFHNKIAELLKKL